MPNGVEAVVMSPATLPDSRQVAQPPQAGQLDPAGELSDSREFTLEGPLLCNGTSGNVPTTRPRTCPD